MKKITLTFLLTASLLFYLKTQAQNLPADKLYHKIDSLITHKQFFAARELLHTKKESLSPFHYLKLGAAIDNVFNQLDASNAKIDALIQGYDELLDDSTNYHLLYIRQSNYGKLYEYQKALESIHEIIDKYKHLLSEKELADFKNTRTIWQNLAGQAKQEVILKETVAIKMSRDRAGLANLPVSNGADSLGFIFDTGANISTVTESVAARFGMTLMDSVIDVTSITGNKIKSRIAVCKDLYLRSIHIKNAVFLVFPDAALYIPQISYQINGILGFPVIEALGEVQISREDEFVVPLQHSAPTQLNLALDFLTPVIEIAGDSYTFDTGADETMLYKPYYQKYPKKFRGKRERKRLKFGGAGGSVTRKGYLIDFEARLGDQNIRLRKIMAFSEPTRENIDGYFGNIGQDLIGKFDRMILNFKTMFIRFE